MIIIGITGTIGAGKGTIVKYLVEKYNFNHFSVRDYLLTIIHTRQLQPNRNNMVMIANELREKNGNSFIIEKLAERAIKANHNAVIESIRHPDEINALRKFKHFYLFSVDADIKIRYQRIRQRGLDTDNITFEEFKKEEEREMHSPQHYGQNIKKCIEKADYFFNNNGNFVDLYVQIDKVLVKILKLRYETQ